MIVKFIDDTGVLVQHDDGGLQASSIRFTTEGDKYVARVVLADGVVHALPVTVPKGTDMDVVRAKMFNCLRAENASILLNRARASG